MTKNNSKKTLDQTAALLILRKKSQAIWGMKRKDY